MAVTAWEVINPGIVDGAPVATPGVVVNGASTTAPAGPSTGRGYPRT